MTVPEELTELAAMDLRNEGHRVAEAALRIAERFPQLASFYRDVNNPHIELQQRLSTPDYIVIARLALGLEC